jgi:uncharacterized damage-inducible protein DinB
MQTHFAMFAAYNRWANALLYGAAAKLPDVDYHADRGAFFGSLHGTLNHLLVTDRIWLRRFTGSGPQPTRLSEILFDDLPSLSNARTAEDARIVAFVDGLTEADLVGTFTYRTITRPADITQPLAPALSHFFNHQTHHRGQAHTLLTIAAGRDAAPSLDLIYFQRETGIRLS